MVISWEIASLSHQLDLMTRGTTTLSIQADIPSEIQTVFTMQIIHLILQKTVNNSEHPLRDCYELYTILVNIMTNMSNTNYVCIHMTVMGMRLARGDQVDVECS